MTTKQGDLSMLQDPIAQELLHSKKMAKVAYVWKDGTPRIIPIWFLWNGKELVFGTPPIAPKNQVITDGTKVAVVIDTDDWPYKVLTIRGVARVDTTVGVSPEYAACSEFHFGPEEGNKWVQQVNAMYQTMTRIFVEPEWVSILDFQKRFPYAIEKAMESMQSS